MNKPRFSATVRDRRTGATVTLDYNSLHTLAEDFSKVIKTLADVLATDSTPTEGDKK